MEEMDRGRTVDHPSMGINTGSHSRSRSRFSRIGHPTSMESKSDTELNSNRMEDIHHMDQEENRRNGYVYSCLSHTTPQDCSHQNQLNQKRIYIAPCIPRIQRRLADGLSEVGAMIYR